MIARIWHGTTLAEKSDEYLKFLNETGISDYRQIEGNLGAYVLRRIDSGVAHFFAISFWESVDAIREFTGEDHEKARYYPQDEGYLIELESSVEHYELFGEIK